MKITKFLCLLVLVVGLSVSASAQQPYERGIGMRFSPSNYYETVSATYKFFITDAGAIDLNAGFGLRGRSGYTFNNVYYDKVNPFTFAISAAYQHHFEIPVRGGGFAWFIGGGLTALRTFSDNGDYDGFGFGLFPTGGVDYKIPKIPLAVSADYRPTFFLASPKARDEFFGSNVGVSVRYTFGKN